MRCRACKKLTVLAAYDDDEWRPVWALIVYAKRESGVGVPRVARMVQFRPDAVVWIEDEIQSEIRGRPVGAWWSGFVGDLQQFVRSWASRAVR